jgi:putative ABC transport system permease protein
VKVALELGPILRSSKRHKATFMVVVMQLASSFTVVSWLFLLTGWVHGVGGRPVGFDERDLIEAAVRVPVGAAGADRPGLEAVTALPDVQAATRIDPGVRGRARFVSLLFAVDGGGGNRRGPEVFGWSTYTTPALFAVLGVPFLEGGAPRGPDEVVLTRSLRQRLFPGEPCLGRTVGADDAAPARVAGVVPDVLMRTGLTVAPAVVAFRFGPPPGARETTYLVRSRPGARHQVAARLGALLGPAGPNRLLEVTALGVTPTPQRAFGDGLLVIFAIVGTALAIIAVVGALALSSYLVAERTRQIGIRRALGATRWAVVRYFLVENALAGALGIALGAVITLGLYLLTAALIPEMTLSAAPLAGAALVLWGAALLAGAIPARRAARISPALATRGR